MSPERTNQVSTRWQLSSFLASRGAEPINRPSGRSQGAPPPRIERLGPLQGGMGERMRPACHLRRRDSFQPSEVARGCASRAHHRWNPRTQRCESHVVASRQQEPYRRDRHRASAVCGGSSAARPRALVGLSMRQLLKRSGMPWLSSAFARTEAVRMRLERWVQAGQPNADATRVRYSGDDCMRRVVHHALRRAPPPVVHHVVTCVAILGLARESNGLFSRHFRRQDCRRPRRCN
jgi:hypothetical protein